MPEIRNSLHVFTGGPGAGKTTLIEALRARGFLCMDEVARVIIREQIAIGGNIHHNGDRVAYRDLMLERAIASYESVAGHDAPVFFDRGIPELTGYSRLIGAPVPKALTDAIVRCRYAPKVFVFPPWEEIYAHDTERKQDFAEAVKTWDLCAQAYREAGYECVEMPRASVAARVDFVLMTLGLTGT